MLANQFYTPQEHKRQNYVINCNIIGQWNVETSVWNSLNPSSVERNANYSNKVSLSQKIQSNDSTLWHHPSYMWRRRTNSIQYWANFQSVSTFQWVKLRSAAYYPCNSTIPFSLIILNRAAECISMLLYASLMLGTLRMITYTRAQYTRPNRMRWILSGKYCRSNVTYTKISVRS